jgi:hypothetical protein
MGLLGSFEQAVNKNRPATTPKNTFDIAFI